MGLKLKAGTGLSLGKVGLGLGFGHASVVTGTTILGTALMVVAGVLVISGVVGLAKRKKKGVQK